MNKPPLRAEILAKAREHTTGDRDIEYGPPTDNLSDVARMWTAYLQAKYDFTEQLDAEDAAWLNVIQKIARTFNGVPKRDTYEDAAAYSAIAGECANDKW